MSGQTRYERKVSAVLEANGFIVGEREKQLIREQTKNGRRYFFMTARRRERGKAVQRFIKIPENSSKKLLEPFKRQIEFAKYLKEHNIIPTRGVIASNVDPKQGTPFAIIETFPKADARIGFIWRDYGSEKLGRREAQSVFKHIEKLHEARWTSVPKNLRRLLKKFPRTYEELAKKVRRALTHRVLSLDAKNGKSEVFHAVLARRLKRPGFRKEVAGLLAKWKPIIESPSNRRPTLIHGDLAPNNLYVFDSGKVEFIDYEWAGFSDNAAIAMIYDFGHVRARAWASAEFRKTLDGQLLKTYAQAGKTELGRAIVSLGILLFSTQLSRDFENYKLDKQRLRRQKHRRVITEQEVLEAWNF